MSRAPRVQAKADPNNAILDRRNPGAPLDIDWLRAQRVSRAAIERSAVAFAAQSPLRAEQQAGLLLRAVTCFDLTPADCTDALIHLGSACATARRPISSRTLVSLGAEHLPLQVGALCVPCDHIADAAGALRSSGIPVGGSSPAGGRLEERLEEIASCAADGADEMDAEVPASLITRADWPSLYAEVSSFRLTCGSLMLKAALPLRVGTGTGTLFRAVLVCAMAGADFVAIPWSPAPAMLSAVSAIRAYCELTGHRVGLKLGGGVKTARDTLDAFALVKQALGAEWLRPALFRMAVDTTLAGVDRQLEHYANGTAARPSRRAA